MEPLSYDSPVETDVVRRYLTSAKVFMSASAGTPSRDLLHANDVKFKEIDMEVSIKCAYHIDQWYLFLHL